MKASLRILPTMLATFILAACASIPPPATIDRIVVFGDSNVDNGNLLRITDGALPRPPNWKGRNSNGPNVAEYLADRLAVKHDNYAVSGAFSGEENIFVRFAPNLAATIGRTGVSAQIEQFAKEGKSLGPQDVVILWAGSNDIFGIKRADTELLQTRIAQVTRNLETALNRLVGYGARRIVVATRTPREALENENDLNGIDLNRAIAAMARGFSERVGVKVIVYDAYASIRDMMLNPARYGFSQVDALCMSVPACVGERFEDGLRVADGYVNWDAAHKTTRVHHLMAEQLEQLLRE